MMGSLKRLRDMRFIRYFVASVGALAVDMGSFLLLLDVGTPAGFAAAIAYTLGIIAHWVLLSRAVFEDGVAERGLARTQQKALFLVTTLAGLGLTTAIVILAEALGADVVATKGVAVLVSFLLNWWIRKRYIFKPLAVGA